MKTLLVSLNSKFIHSSLAPWYLKACCGPKCGEVKVREFTINESPDKIMEAIYREKPDILAFSCYIWNISLILRLVCDLKMVKPEMPVILGGPEVSYETEALLKENICVDYIISGEGEESFSMLLRYLSKGRGSEISGSEISDSESECSQYECSEVSLSQIPGLSFRQNGIIQINRPRAIEDLNSIPTPYTDEMLSSLGDRIVYFESSRGCPFSCSYCLSSISGKVRYFSLVRVKGELLRLAKAGIRQVKFVDRTFNCNRERALEIFRLIIEISKDKKISGLLNNEGINFHFEAAADLFDSEMLELLATAPAGLIQMEIGVQTFNEVALEAIKRKTDLIKVCENTRKILSNGNIHVHLDLIAGLPYEDFNSFRKSFDSVYALKPHKLQLGFLKLLKGTEIRRDADRSVDLEDINASKHDYRYRDYPPYEILENAYLKFGEILKLKGVEELVERYYNSGRFVKTLEYVTSAFHRSSFDFYMNFSEFMQKSESPYLPPALRDLYSLLHRYVSDFAVESTLTLANELMKLDFLASDSSGCLPAALTRYIPEGFRDNCFEFLKNESNLKRFLPDFVGMSAKQIYKKVHFEYFRYDISQSLPDIISDNPQIILFNYSRKDSVTGLFKYTVVKFSA